MEDTFYFYCDVTSIEENLQCICGLQRVEASGVWGGSGMNEHRGRKPVVAVLQLRTVIGFLFPPACCHSLFPALKIRFHWEFFRFKDC